jgi:hypothetical protein
LFVENVGRCAGLGYSLVRVEGKKAVGRGWELTLPDAPELAKGKWSHFGKRWNIGVVCGPSGLAVLDVDIDDDPDRAACELLGLAELPETPIVRTGSGKLQIYFADPGGLQKRARDGFELRVGAHMCVLPPSEHPDTGQRYTWERPPWDVPLAPLPERLIEFFTARKDGRRAGPLPKKVVKGGRHAELLSLAGSMRARGLTAEEMLPTLRAWNERHCEPPKSEAELRALAVDVEGRWEPTPPHPADLELLQLLEQLPGRAPAPAAAERPRVRRAESWEQPVPLRDRPQVPPFPLAALPRWQRQWAEAISNEKGARVDLAATLSLGAVAGGLARHVVVEPRAGWTEPLNLYLAIALEPGQRKTPLFKIAIRPVRALERRRILEWEENAKLSELSSEIYVRRRRELIGDSADDDELSPELLAERAAALYDGLGETKQPPKPRLLTEDVTPEGLASLLADHGRIVAASDEGAILFENFSGRYTHGSANWDLLNKAHSAGDLVVDRKTSSTVFVWDPALTLVIATQPRVIADLWGKPGAEARGVLARPLYVLPDPVYATGRTAAADAAVLAEYERRVRALYEDVPTLMLDEDERPLPVVLRLDADAAELFERYELELAEERRALGTSEEAEGQAAYLGWLSKFAGQTARLAACLHAAVAWGEGSTVNVTIGVDTVADAVELARYFHRHALVVFGLMGELPEQRRAGAVLGWLKARTPQERETLTVRDVHRTRGKGTTAPEVRAALRLLEEHGFIRIEKPARVGRGGRASELIHVHPELEISSVWPDKPDVGTSEPSSVGSVGSDAKDSARGHRDPEVVEGRDS